MMHWLGMDKEQKISVFSADLEMDKKELWGKIILENYSTHKIMTSDKSINLYNQSEAFQLVRGRLACLPPQTKQDKQREARR